jgi:2-C-methyl-D-erythritol 4-phosphate cytidylyltransferase/2-C-methyl-D-erythritol 2,4-cyclodiphosphate synthase
VEAVTGAGATWAVVVAAGAGTRFGAPKQWAPLAGRRVLDWAVAAVRSAPSCDGVVLVVPAADVGTPAVRAVAGVDVVVGGGATRSASVRAGLAALPATATVVVVHDGARPLARPALLEAVVAAVRAGADAALPATPVTDTVKRVAGDGVVTGTVDRTDLVAVQTPQAFARAALVRAHAGDPEATDDAALVEAIGGRVVVVAGDPENLKLTDAGDLAVAATRLAAGAPAGPVPAVRVGLGFDVHPHTDDPGRTLVLGGIAFPGARGLAGHSDADVIAHAATDALLGAAGLGDIGQHFPDTDPRYAGADSLELLRVAAGRVRDAGWAPGNVDCSVVCDEPKLTPHRAAMEEGLAAAVGAPVSVKGRRPEGLGALGRGEGVACWAVATVIPLQGAPA